MMGLRQPSLSFAENAFYAGAKSQDVILSADVPGWHSSTTRQRRLSINKLISGKHLLIAFSGSRCFLRASDRERHFLAYFFFAVEKEVSRQKGEKTQFR
jgi:hypothetical protein